jgi:hypothetical protein
MPVILLLFLTPACLIEQWPDPASWFVSPEVSVGLTWFGVFLEIVLALLITRRTKRALAAGQSRESALRGYLRGRSYHMLGLFLTYGLGLYAFNYGGAVHYLWARDGKPMPGAELLLLAPFFATLILSWACFYGAERAFWAESDDSDGTPPRFFTRLAFVWFHLRQNLALVFLPVLLIVAEKELRRLFPSLGDSWQTQASIGGTVMVLAVFLTMPWILRLVLGMRPLPDGPLRQRLLAQHGGCVFASAMYWSGTRGGASPTPWWSASFPTCAT